MKILTITAVVFALLFVPFATALAAGSVTISAPDTALPGASVTVTFTNAQTVTITDNNGTTIFSDTGGLTRVTFGVPTTAHYVYITAIGADGSTATHTITVVH